MYNHRKVAFLFSGVGSQFVEMGVQYFKEYEVFRNQMEFLDDAFYNHSRISVIDELYIKHNKAIINDNTVFACISLFQVQYAMAQFLIAQGIVPDVLLGTSLGEYVAYAVSGGVDVIDIMLYLYDVIGNIQKNSPKCGMLTVLGNVKNDYLDNEKINMFGAVGAINYDGHFVISGRKEEIDQLEVYYKENGNYTYRVPSNIAFHNIKIFDSYSSVANFYMKSLHIDKMRIPVVSCMNEKIIYELKYNYLFDVLKKPILFKSAFEILEAKEKLLFLDLGPMGTLEGFVKKNMNNRNVNTYSFMNTFNDKWKQFEY